MDLKQWLLLGLTIDQAIQKINSVIVAELVAKHIIRVN